jgi:hypothetical protein
MGAFTAMCRGWFYPYWLFAGRGFTGAIGRLRGASAVVTFPPIRAAVLPGGARQYGGSQIDRVQ